jgi:hypothetical protein
MASDYVKLYRRIVDRRMRNLHRSVESSCRARMRVREIIRTTKGTGGQRGAGLLKLNTQPPR